MTIQRLVTNILSDRLPESRDFYADLLGLRIVHDSDWYVQLAAPDNARLELGIIRRDHDLVPASWQAAPAGMYLTFVVNSVDAVHARAVGRGLPIVQPPRNEFYGQRRLLVLAPDGCLVDVSSPWRGVTSLPAGSAGSVRPLHRPQTDRAPGEHEVVDGFIGRH